MRRAVKLKRRNKVSLLCSENFSWKNYYFISNLSRLKDFSYLINYSSNFIKNSLFSRYLFQSGSGLITSSSQGTSISPYIHRSSGFRHNLLYLNLTKKWSFKLYKGFYLPLKLSQTFFNKPSSFGIFSSLYSRYLVKRRYWFKRRKVSIFSRRYFFYFRNKGVNFFRVKRRR